MKMIKHYNLNNENIFVISKTLEFMIKI